MPTRKSIRVMDAEGIARSLTRIAHEILERNKNVDRLARCSQWPSFLRQPKNTVGVGHIEDATGKQ